MEELSFIVCDESYCSARNHIFANCLTWQERMKFQLKTNNVELENEFLFSFKSVEKINYGYWMNTFSSGVIGLAPL